MSYRKNSICCDTFPDFLDEAGKKNHFKLRVTLEIGVTPSNGALSKKSHLKFELHLVMELSLKTVVVCCIRKVGLVVGG